MTDARFPERWILDRRFQQIHRGGHFWCYMVTLAWSAANRTDGVISDSDVIAIPFLSPEDIEAFTANRLWKRRRGGWLILDYLETQSTAAVLDDIADKRRADRERKQKERAKERAKKQAETSTDEPCPVDSPADSPVEVPAPVHPDVHGMSPRPRTRTRPGSGEQDQSGSQSTGSTSSPSLRVVDPVEPEQPAGRQVCARKGCSQKVRERGDTFCPFCARDQRVGGSA